MNRLEDNLFSLKHLLVPIVGLSVLSSIGAFQVDKEILYDISATLLDKKGHTFEV